MKLIFLLYVLTFQDNTPYKPNDEFELKMDYQIKQRSPTDSKVLDYSGLAKSTGPLPYLTLDLRILKINDGEDRVRITDNTNATMLNKKLKPGLVLKLDLGYTDDMKDRVTPYEFTVMLLNADNKEAVSQIVILIDEDGNFLVNGEKRGKL
ncbi:MAG TPA: hypothetical protein VFW11_09440 [Cyclobacteriaceae bacterium]|nr:hypothetical protein [Cyclobacteriaceae bacterium]